jgi:hypothetical protein
MDLRDPHPARLADAARTPGCCPARHLFQLQKPGQCDPGYARLAKELCISSRSARRCVTGLVARGFVGRDEGAGGRHDQKQNFSLFMPPARGTDHVSPVRRTDSMSPVETEEPDQPGGQKQGVTGDKNRGRRGTTRRPTKEPDEPEEPDSSAVPAERTADDDRESVSNSTSVDAPLNPAFSTSDDAPTSAPERPVPRADARTEPVAAQQQPPSHASESIGAAANGSDDADAGRCDRLWVCHIVIVGVGSREPRNTIRDRSKRTKSFAAY